MSPSALALHCLSFLGPAAFLALAVATAGRLLGAGPRRLGWWAALAADFAAGSVVLALGLWFFGTDGKMATYAALVVVVASVEWIAVQGWRR